MGGRSIRIKKRYKSDMSDNMNTFALKYESYMKQDVTDKVEQERLIKELIRAETDLEYTLLHHPDFREGLFFGTPRYGHPEGKIILHIREVMDNVERIPLLNPIDREKLRLITLVHDVFKNKEAESRKIKGRRPDNHHAVYAAEFVKQFINDEQLITLIRLHDEAYYCWQLYKRDRQLECQIRLDNLLDALGDSLQLFYLFFKCDTRTGDKNQEPLEWFERTVKGIERIDF